MKPNAVIVVSAFGRADNLAVELQRKGFEVSLVDCTERLMQGQNLGAGPFPIVSDSPGSQYLESTVKSENLERGLVFWLPEGPIELSGPMADFFKSNKVELQQIEILQNGKKASAEFKQKWLWLFLHQLVSPWFAESTKADLVGEAFNPKASMFLVNSTNFLKSLAKATSDAGVARYNLGALENIEIDNNRILDLGLKTNFNWNGKTAHYVWALSSYETERLNSGVAQKLFSGKVLEPTWQWIRFDLRSSVGSWCSGFPSWQVVIEDIYLPWTHTNSFILQKGPSGNWEVWLKVPHHRLQDPKSWFEWARGVEAVLIKRIPHGQWVCDEGSLNTDPQGLIFDIESYGWQPPKIQNLLFCAHEVLEQLDWGHWSKRLMELVPKLEDLKNREQKKYKGASSDHALHAP